MACAAALMLTGMYKEEVHRNRRGTFCVNIPYHNIPFFGCMWVKSSSSSLSKTQEHVSLMEQGNTSHRCRTLSTGFLCDTDLIFKILLFVFKALNGLTPSCLVDLSIDPTPLRAMRFADQTLPDVLGSRLETEVSEHLQYLLQKTEDPSN